MEAERLDQTLSKLGLEITGRLRSGATDKVAFDGAGQSDGKTTKIKLTGKIGTIHGDSYLALAELLSEEGGARSAETRQSGEGEAGSPEKIQNTGKNPQIVNQVNPSPRSALRAPRSSSIPPPASVVLEIAALEIGKISCRGTELSDAKGSFRFENGSGEFRLTQGRVSGGSLAGNVQFNVARLEPRYAWEVAMKQVDLQKLLTAVAPEQAAHFKGKGDIASKGSGEGTGEAAKRRLQSETGFVLSGGLISDFFLLDAIAKQTKIEQFKSVQFDEFSGRIVTADGVATLKDWIERGKEQRISLEGTVTLDGRYDLLFQPAVTQKMAGKLGKNQLAQQLLVDSQGFFSLPFQVAISGEGTNYQLGGRTTLDKNVKGALDQNMRNVLQGVVGRQSPKGQGLKGDSGATSEGFKAPRPGLDQLKQQLQPGGSSKQDKKKKKGSTGGGINIGGIKIPGVK